MVCGVAALHRDDIEVLGRGRGDDVGLLIPSFDILDEEMERQRGANKGGNGEGLDEDDGEGEEQWPSGDDTDDHRIWRWSVGRMVSDQSAKRPWQIERGGSYVHQLLLSGRKETAWRKKRPTVWRKKRLVVGRKKKRQLREITRDLLLGGIVKDLLCLEEEKDATLKKKKRKKKHFAWRNKKRLLGR